MGWEPSGSGATEDRAAPQRKAARIGKDDNTTKGLTLFRRQAFFVSRSSPHHGPGRLGMQLNQPTSRPGSHSGVAPSTRRGRYTENRVPARSSDCASMAPPWPWTISRVM